MRILDLPSSLHRTVEAKIGWSRMGMAGSFMLLAAAFAILCVMLRGVGLDKVVVAVRATPTLAVLAACVFVFIGYCVITLYDYSALRAIGRHEVPYATAALAGFASYAIGHGIGIGLLTGGAVRLRIYSNWGLGIFDVAKIAFITGLTFWLGNVCALGFALTFAPSAALTATQLPQWANRMLGVVALLGIVGYVAWLLRKPRILGFAKWLVTLPNARLTFVQIGIGILDLAAGSLALYALLPAAPPSDYSVIAVAYVIAALVGFLSHAPGSLGVFEVTVFVLLPQYPKEELLASLLILHFLYLVLPFAVAFLMVGMRETSLARSANRN